MDSRSHDHRWALGALAILALLASPLAQAQSMHRCTEGGRTYYSDRACPVNGSTRITSYGPEPVRPSYSGSTSARMPKAPEHLGRMSAECASLSEAIRTSRARGVGHDTRAELQEEYSRKCREEEAVARKELRDTETQRRTEAREQRKAEQQEQAQARMTLEQCREMGRIVGERRKRLDAMTPGERGDFERFQANFSERCKGL